MFWILGEDSEIKLGVAIGLETQPHRFHAWVEDQGQVVNDVKDVALQYLPLTGVSADLPNPNLFD